MEYLNIVILAAGKGSRMGSAVPKVLHSIGGVPMLQRVIRTAAALAPQHLMVVYGQGGELVRQTVSEPDVVWVEQTEQLGTGHALKTAVPFLRPGGKTLVLYGDVPLIRVTTLAALIKAAGSGAAVLTNMCNDPTNYGRVVRSADGYLQAIIEDKDCTTQQKTIKEVNTGVMVLPTEHVARWLSMLNNHNAQKEYYLTDVVGLALRDGVCVRGIIADNSYEVVGVNDKIQLAILERMLQTYQAQALLESGVTLLDPARIDIRGELLCGRDVNIDVNCVFEGRVALGDGVTIGPNCVLKNVDVAAGTVIAAFSFLEGTVVGKECRIGPYARLRPNSQLSEHVHIGNFVEVKKSMIAARSKINHLTYIGDAHIGCNVNIGAGCVTVNYDGIGKYRTVIEDDVFVGSGTMLVAPVTLQQGATIGAGSVIDHEAPAGKLTIARTRQVTVPHWERPQKKP